MRTYYLQEKINNKWITREESNSREILVVNKHLEYASAETRIIPITEMKKAYVVTYYYNNGEYWEDEYYYEAPQKVYMNLGDALKKDDFTKVEDDEYIYRSVEHKFEEDEDDLHPDEYYEYRIYECEVQE